MERMNWNKLMSIKRERTSTSGNGGRVISETRNEFEKDYDRIVSSSSVRRLQDKAQVFPLQENDFTRTRLTHSLEVSAMARSIGKQIGYFLESNEDSFGREQTEQLEALVQTAGLVHDLGNPPFGHYGETAINNWFKDFFRRKDVRKKLNLSKQQKRELRHYDGNVQNIRILTKLQVMNDRYGANFTYGTLAAIMKYPYSIVNARDGKYGFFASEQDIVNRIWEATGLKEGIRHPAVYIMEAADDIVYIGDDIEDGVKKRYIPWDKEYNKLKADFGETHKELFKKIDGYTVNESFGEEDRLNAKVRYFRNIVQGYLLEKAVKQFTTEYDNIMCGRYEGDLLKTEKLFVKALKDITARNCFGCREVLALELVGNTVIRGLLDIFIPAFVFTKEPLSEDDTKTQQGKLYHIISSNFKYVARQDYSNSGNAEKDIAKLEIYDKIRLVVDFISGMTDSYAMHLYQELSGIRLHYQ